MKFTEDPRMKGARRCLLVAWVFFALYLIVYMGLSYTLGIEPYVLGLPGWVTVGNLFVPFLFVLGLIIVVEKFIPDVPLTDREAAGEEEAAAEKGGARGTGAGAEEEKGKGKEEKGKQEEKEEERKK